MKRALPVVLIALLAIVAAYVASSKPDGLERVAIDQGFADRAADPQAAPMPGYELPGAPAHLSAPVAGLLGAAAVGLLAFGAGRLLAKGRRP